MNVQRCLRSVVGILLGLSTSLAVSAGDYTDHPNAKLFVDRMVAVHGFDRLKLQAVLGQAVKRQNILDAIARPAEKSKPWHEYRPIFLDANRISQGAKFWQENAETLARVSAEYGVEPEVIVAIIGVETRYGANTGSYRVLDALTTLGFDYPPREPFFKEQLEQFFLLTREQKQDPLALTGSYAGAMGYGQFMPSSYRTYARDFDGDGIVDIWTNKKDAIASVANYFKEHGWKKGQPVVSRVKVRGKINPDDLGSRDPPSKTVKMWRSKGVITHGRVRSDSKALLLEYQQPQTKEYWLGFNNFYVITRYNRSHMYALAVWQLAEAIRKEHAKTR